MSFYAVRYGNSTRISKASGEREACLDAYGIYVPDQMTLKLLPGNPKYLAQKVVQPLYRELEERHSLRKLIADGKASKYECDDCKLPIIIEPAQDKPVPCLCGKCDPCQSDLLDNKYHNLGKEVIDAALLMWYPIQVSKK